MNDVIELDDDLMEVDEERLEEALQVALDWDDDAPDEEDEADETAESVWNSELHPRAAAGTAGGGQFAAGGSSAGAGKSAAAKKAAPAAKKSAMRKGPQALSYDAKTGRGAGYGVKGGDKRVHKLQQALNRLGLTDTAGHRLLDDGKLGPRTTAALKKAQRKLGLPADGKLTPQLLAKLVAAKSLTKKPKTHAHKAPAKKAAPKAAPKARPTSTTTTAQSGGTTFTMTRRSQEGDMTDAQPEGTFETLERIGGRVLEAKGTDEAGGRIFRVQIIEAGDSKNARRYPQPVLAEGARLYEGAKAYDHHRTTAELQSSTIAGLVGSYRNVEATGTGLEGDLHLLPSATHTAEALDASIAAQEQGLPPLVGISHDAMTYTRPITVGGRRMQEAVRIAKVHSADVVADPAAGGKAVRVLAGGIEETDPADAGESIEEDDVPITSQTVLAALKDASPEDLAAVGLSKVEQPTETAPPAVEPAPTTESVSLGVDKASFLGGLMIERKVESAGLPATLAAQLAGTLPDRITESDVDAQVAAIKSALGMVERSGLTPTVTTTVTQESIDKKVEALDKFFAGDYTGGYRSFREAVLDFTGYRPRSWGEDVNKVLLRECIGDGQYDADGRLQGGAKRSTESMTASTWSLVLGDSLTRRLVAEYNQPNLQTWRQVVSSIVPINDFRTQRIDRIGGYGVLPTVAQGAPYQPLTSPTNEEVTYAIAKRGGTEDLTLEMIANDDVRAISKIPTKLGLAAAQTVYRYVWDMIVTNGTIYDSTALFTTGHGNYVNAGSGSALSQSALSAARLLMTSQTAYGDATDFIAPTPQYLVFVNDLEELAWQLCHSAVALPTPANTPPNSTGAANTPNLHQGLIPIRLDYPASTTAWWTVADPNQVPTIEMGFYLGRQDPELFTQSDQTVGSMFNADKFTYKIRHAYNGAPLDFRGFVKGN
jgi:peptidoglycan hydrolase-like protein with peptidoglycan-binding domain